MNTTQKSVGELLEIARQNSPLLSEENTEDLLQYVDKRRRIGWVLLHFAATFFDGYVGIAMAAIGFVVGTAATILYVNEGHSEREKSNITELRESLPPESLPISSQNSLTVLPSFAKPASSNVAHSQAWLSSAVDSTLPTVLNVASIAEAGIIPFDILHARNSFGEPGMSNTVCAAASTALLVPVAAEFVPDLFSMPGNGEASGLTVFVESGSSYSSFRGGLRSTFSGSDIRVPQNFATATGGWGMHSGAGIAMPLASWLRASGAVRITQLATTYSSPDILFVQSAGTQTLTDVHVTHSAALTIGEIALEPAMRIQPSGSSLFFDAGVSVGFLYRQSVSYSTSITSVPAGTTVSATSMPAPRQQQTIASGRTQFDMRIGVGTAIPLGAALCVDVEICGEYGLVPLFADNYPRRLSITPVLGFRFLVP